MPLSLSSNSSPDEIYEYLVHLHQQQAMDNRAREASVRQRLEETYSKVAFALPQSQKQVLRALADLHDAFVVASGKAMLVQGAFSCVASLIEMDIGLPQARQAATKFTNIVKLAGNESSTAQKAALERFTKIMDLVADKNKPPEAAPPHSSKADLSAPGQILLNMDFDEWAVLDNCLEAARQNIIKKTALTKQALSRTEDDVAKRIEHVREALRAQAIESTKSMPDYKLQMHMQGHTAFLHTLLSVIASVDEAVMEWMAEEWRKS